MKKNHKEMKTNYLYTVVLCFLYIVMCSGCKNVVETTKKKQHILSHVTYTKIEEPELVEEDTDETAIIEEELDKKDTIYPQIVPKSLFQQPITGKIIDVINKNGKVIAAKIIPDKKQSVFVMYDGVVVSSKSIKSHGNTIIVYSKEYNIKIAYGCLDILRFEVGDKVSKGQVIGVIEDLEEDSLFLAVQKNSFTINPRDLLEQKNKFLHE